ncbi:nitroreductase [Treponema sp.]|uniref:nitroreductase n=1 Tax=Treponema sp. TaxID=166 RepID=UPI00257BCCC7|nr:nitroreductase [Treponema sp.]MBE6355029.1 nitroreductase family protein [Treponema sp.]
MSDILNELISRRSCRSYKDQLITKEELDKILTAGKYAASGKGKQSTIIISVTSRELRDRLSKMNAAVLGNPDFDPFYGAPQLLIVLAQKDFPTAVYDGSLVMGNMMAEASSLGIGNCWIHRAKEEFESEEGKKILKDLGIEGEWEGIAHLILGYPASAELPKAASRKENFVYTA